MSDHKLSIWGASVWDASVSVYVGPSQTEIQLPEWSGRLSADEALAGIAELRKFLDRAEAMIREAKT